MSSFLRTRWYRWYRRDAFATLVLVASVAACGASSPATPTPAQGTESAAPSTDLASYFTTPAICADGVGPDCTRLRLGDLYFTTSTPAVGRMYSCVPANASAPGSNRARITWIDDAAGTWNLLRKPFLPRSTATPAAGAITVTEQGDTRTIQSNNLPLDAKQGDWPMTRYTVLSAIDGNPGTPAARNVTFTLPTQPALATTPGCLPMGSIGITLNGVLLYNAADARGNDAVANEIVDVYGGHPAMSDYHYHYVPERLDQSRGSDGHSGIIGYIRDGFALYGYHGVGGVKLSNADLDVCHGHSHGTLGYHYHATVEYPYTVGCYRGTPR